ncbi:MAG TPA: hypothetical protein VJ453_08280 [Terriglobales bacterium]|nr:hypothetical protein [Terriglobales bacterium]
MTRNPTVHQGRSMNGEDQQRTPNLTYVSCLALSTSMTGMSSTIGYTR